MNILKKILEERGALDEAKKIREVSAEQASLEKAEKMLDELNKKWINKEISWEAGIGELRRPELLFTKISKDLIDQGITREAWKKADVMTRMKMLENAMELMHLNVTFDNESMGGVDARLTYMDESGELDPLMKGRVEAPDAGKNLGVQLVLRAKTLIREYEDRKVFGDNLRFVEAVPNGDSYDIRLEKDTSFIFTRLPIELAYAEDLDTALRPLVVNSLMNMAQMSLLEPDVRLYDPSLKDAWRQEIIDACNGVMDSQSKYAGSIFEFAVNQLPEFSNYFDQVCKKRGV